MTKIRTSYGIALCRYNKKKNNQVEIILIKKRYSYYFFNFVFGYYKRNNDKNLKYLFDNMSYSEKIDILGMQFSQMWYRIALNNPDKNFNLLDIYPSNKNESKVSDSDRFKKFVNLKSVFEKNFCNEIGTKKIKNLIINSSSVELMWEIPKGGKDPKETDIDCAIREFYEETSIDAEKYRILYNIEPVIYSYKDQDIVYRNIYYIAQERCNTIEPILNFKNHKQIYEVEQLKWVNLTELKFLSLDPKTHKKMIILYKTIINKFKKSQTINFM